MRNGNWDPYEELPAEYSQIHEFQDIQFTTKQAFAALAEGGAACVNKYCRLHLVPVAGPDAAPVSPDTAIPLVASSAGAAEAKVTVDEPVPVTAPSGWLRSAGSWLVPQ